MRKTGSVSARRGRSGAPRWCAATACCGILLFILVELAIHAIFLAIELALLAFRDVAAIGSCLRLFLSLDGAFFLLNLVCLSISDFTVLLGSFSPVLQPLVAS